MSSESLKDIQFETKYLDADKVSPSQPLQHLDSEILTETDEFTTSTDSKWGLSKASLFSSTLFYNLLLATVILSVAVTGFQLYLKRSISHSSQVSNNLLNQTEESPCGSNANSARHAGCNFDPLTFAWLPPACYDWNLTAEFIALQDWEYYRQRDDGSRRQLSLINIMQSSDEILYVSWEFHRQHCAYLWLKMHRAMLERRAIDGVTMLGIITDVCEGVMKSTREGNDTSVPGYIRFPSCKMY